MTAESLTTPTNQSLGGIRQIPDTFQPCLVLRIEPFIFAIIICLSSCDRPEPASEKPTDPGNDSSLAAAQLALAELHSANHQQGKAIPYLQAAQQESENDKATDLLTEILSSARFTIPSLLLRHPYPILRFTDDTGKAIFAAVGGKYPTVIRWELDGTPKVTAVLFPTNASDISHISLSPGGIHLLVHRDATNLLCNAATLKPIANLGEFPEYLDPDSCQPFTQNGLLVAHPTKAQNGNYVWHIRDTTTGGILRSESFQPYPKPLSARFEDTTLSIILEDDREIRIPIRGSAEAIDAKGRQHHVAISQSDASLTDKFTIALCLPIPIPTKQKLPAPILSAIAGYELDPVTQTLSELPIPNRLDTLSKAFPYQLPPTLKLQTSETALKQRLAAAYPEDFPNLAAAQIAQAKIIRKTFESGEPAAIAAVINSADPGLPLATALFLSLKSGNPSFIKRTTAKTENMPPALRNLVKRGTLATLNPGILRLEQDWLGYESPDFTPLFNKFRARNSETFSELSLPDNPTSRDIATFTSKLLDPQNLATLGKATLAERAITAAAVLAKNPEHATNALQIAGIAGRLGAQQALCLRTKAIASTTSGDFTAAHRYWIDLITNQPEANHLASDYSEAAYTAFETGDVRQAMEILHTGLFRFQNDAAFAIRAAWIALLTDHPEQALTYLTHATKLGLPPAEIENTTALLTITHAQLGDPETASSYLAQLKAISPKWKDTENMNALPWPQSFKSSLKEIISQLPETAPEPSPESGPTNTAPQSGELPIPEPPLPSR